MKTITKPVSIQPSAVETIEQKKVYDLLVFIGRFQPLHTCHMQVINTALQKAKNVLVLIGSAGSPRRFRNPWTYAERSLMIEACYPEFGDTLKVKPIFDKTYNDPAWIAQVQAVVKEAALEILRNGKPAGTWIPDGIADLKIGLIGCAKDHSCYYLNMFPQWNSINVEFTTTMDATSIRNMYLDPDHKVQPHELVGNELAKPVVDLLYGHLDNEKMIWPAGFNSTQAYLDLQEEYEFLKKIKNKEKMIKEFLKSEGLPYYERIDQTVDAIIEQSGHILVIRRRAAPGKGLMALPGGYVEKHEPLVDAMLRELAEETKIKLSERTLTRCIVNTFDADDPYRSERGRIISKVFHIKLDDSSEFPKVKGSDDADKAFWIPISELKEEEFFEDHFFVIKKMLGIA